MFHLQYVEPYCGFKVWVLILLLQVTALNLNYSDNGLFGIYTACDGSASGKVGPVVLLAIPGYF